MSQEHKENEKDSIADLFRGISQESTPLAKTRTPFKFLDPYTREDRDLFFGRELEISELYSKFYTSPLLLVYGESGSGKTSLIQCGLRAEIPAEEALFVSMRMATGSTPQEVVGNALKQHLTTPADTNTTSTPLSDLLDEVYRQKSKSVVLVLDQFEELVIFHSPLERLAFAKQLAQWLADKNYLRIIISIREEYYARLSELESVLPTLFDNRLWVRPMSRQQAQEVITQPCKICAIAIESSLSDTLLDDLTHDSKAIDLPILQVVLDRLYQQAKQKQAEQASQSQPILTVASYQALGKINQILTHFVEQRLKAHDNPERSRQVLKAMISAQGTRKISTLEAIQQRSKSFGAAIPLAALQQQLQQLCDDRILREDADNGQYELRHDSLVKPIDHWMTGLEKEMVAIRQDIDNRYQEYLKRDTLLDADFLKVIAPFEQRLHLDKAQQRLLEESQRHHRYKTWRRVIGLIAVLFVALAAVSYQWYQAEQIKKQAKLERESAINLINYMNFELRDKLQPIGQLDLMHDIQIHINQFFDSIKLDIELDEANKDVLRQKIINLQQYADTLFSQGKLEQAQPLYIRGHQWFKRLAKNDPSNVQWQRDLSVSYENLAALYKAIGKADKAFKAYQSSLDIARTLADNDPAKPQFQRDLAMSSDNMANAYKAQGELNKAVNAYQTALIIRQAQVKRDPNNAQWQRDLSISYLYLLHNKTEKARNIKDYQDILDIRKKLAESNPSNAQWQRDLSLSYDSMGAFYQSTDKAEKALKAYQDSLRIRQTLVEKDPSNVQWQRDLSVSFSNHGNLYQSTGKTEQASKVYQDALNIIQTLANKDSSNVQLQRSLSVSFSKLADIAVENKHVKAAQAGYIKALHIVEKLAADEPDTLIYSLDIAEYYYKLAPLIAEKQTHYVQKADDILQQIEQAGKLPKAKQQYFREMKQTLGL